MLGGQMRTYTRELFLKPFLIQETAIVCILVPIVVVSFRTLSLSATVHFNKVAMLAGFAANIGLATGTLTKYLPLRPALALMEKGSSTPLEMKRAVRSLSFLPGAEALVTFLRFGLSGNLIAPVPLYYGGYITYPEFVFAVNAVFMMGFLLVPIVYLISENSLAPFYEKSRLKGVLDGGDRLFHLSISKKTLATMLLISIPALELVLSLTIITDYNRIDRHSLKVALCVIILEALALQLYSGALLMRNLKLSVERMSVMFRDMAKGQGDLTKRLGINGLGEVGELSFWFNEFMDDLEEIVGHVRETSLELDQAIGDVSENSRGLSRATQEQAASVEEVTSSIDEMSVSVKNNSDLVGEGRQTSHAVTGLIGQSKEVFARLMKAIRDVTMDSRKIGDIVSTVNEVSFNTNLLALNASVEAARAGEHGKGFAVVAGEVRSLAQRSADAAGEIRQLIEGTVGRIRNSGEMMESTSASLEELMSRMEDLFAMMEAISTSSSEQLQSIGELSRAITRIGLSTSENAATVEDLASTLDNLRGMANNLASDVRKFKISRAG
jgi:methyl-accepting chemotaxis protein